MRKINVKKIRNTISELCINANVELRSDIKRAITKAIKKETNKKAKDIFKILLENANIASSEKRAICQDTGLVVCDVTIGQDIAFTGGDLSRAIQDGVYDGYKKGFFRYSVISDPLTRKGPAKLAPAVVYTHIAKGNKVKVTVSPKGFGSENKSMIKMFNPTDSNEDIIDFVVETTKNAGPNACPPFVIGVGIGGTFDRSAYLAKKALFRAVDKKNPKKHLQKLEDKIRKKIDALKIGPMGLGGKTTCFGVNVIAEPTHIAGLPVAVNISCHATRSKTVVI